jgi:hypothetical protein
LYAAECPATPYSLLPEKGAFMIRVHGMHKSGFLAGDQSALAITQLD